MNPWRALLRIAAGLLLYPLWLHPAAAAGEGGRNAAEDRDDAGKRGGEFARSAADQRSAGERHAADRRNGAFLSRRFLSDAVRGRALIDEFLPRAAGDLKTLLLVPNGGLLKSDGTLDHPSAGAIGFLERAAAFEKSSSARLTLMPYINGYSPQNTGRPADARVDPGNPQVRAGIVAECLRYLSASVPGSYVRGSHRVFDGIVLDIEPAGDAGLVAVLKTLLMELRSALSAAGLERAKIGFAAPQLTDRVPRPDWGWSASDYHYMARHLDYVFAMTYDSSTRTPAAYADWLERQTGQILQAVSGANWRFDPAHPSPRHGVRVLIGLPAFYAVTRAHDPEFENIATGGAALHVALARLAAADPVSADYFLGAFIYAHDGGAADSPYARYERDWRWWQEDWLHRLR